MTEIKKWKLIVATQCLKNVGLPTNIEAAQALLARLYGDKRTRNVNGYCFLPELQVTTFVFYDDFGTENLVDIRHDLPISPLCTITDLDTKARKVLTAHVAFIREKFRKWYVDESAVYKIDGKKGNEGRKGPRRPPEVQRLIENYRRSNKQDPDLALLHSELKAYAKERGTDAEKLLASVRTTLNKEGLTPKKIREKSRKP